jgi:hypothetical protein
LAAHKQKVVAEVEGTGGKGQGERDKYTIINSWISDQFI